MYAFPLTRFDASFCPRMLMDMQFVGHFFIRKNDRLNNGDRVSLVYLAERRSE